MPTGHKIAFTLNKLPQQENKCYVFLRLQRAQNIYITYNKFHTCSASCAPKDKTNNQKKHKQQKNHKHSPPPSCRFIGSWGLTDSLLSLKRGHFVGDAWQQSTLSKNNELVCLQQWREFIAWILKQKDQTLLNNASPERCPQNLRILCSQHQKCAESCSILKVSLFYFRKVWWQSYFWAAFTGFHSRN